MVLGTGEILEGGPGTCASVTTRRSTCTPDARMMELLVIPLPSTRVTSGREQKVSMTVPGSEDAASRSMSPMVSFIRRIEPARLTRRTAGIRPARRGSSVQRAASFPGGTGRHFPCVQRSPAGCSSRSSRQTRTGHGSFLPALLLRAGRGSRSPGSGEGTPPSSARSPDLRNLPHPAPHVLFQPFEIPETSRVQDLPDLGGDMTPDTGKVLEPVPFGNVVDIFCQGLDPVGSPAVCHRFEFLILDLEEVGDLVQDRCHLPVVQLLRHAVLKRCIRVHGSLMVAMLADPAWGFAFLSTTAFIKFFTMAEIIPETLTLRDVAPVVTEFLRYSFSAPCRTCTPFNKSHMPIASSKSMLGAKMMISKVPSRVDAGIAPRILTNE